MCREHHGNGDGGGSVTSASYLGLVVDTELCLSEDFRPYGKAG
jgi:hypothetical protein